MVTGKKAQGLPLNLIVLAAIAALVLVLVIAFTVGGSGAFFGKIYKGGTTAIGDDLNVARSSCNSLCEQAKLVTTTGAFTGSTYCARTFNIDSDGDGVIGGFDINKQAKAGDKYNAAGKQEKGLACGGAEINAVCTASIAEKTCEYDTVASKCDCK